MHNTVRYILSLLVFFNALHCYGQKNKSDLYVHLLESINEYYDDYLIKNPDKINTVWIDITGLPFGFETDSLHSSMHYVCYEPNEYHRFFRKSLGKGFEIIRSKYRLNKSYLRIVVSRELLLLRNNQFSSTIQDSCVHCYELIDSQWIPSENNHFIKFNIIQTWLRRIYQIF